MDVNQFNVFFIHRWDECIMQGFLVGKNQGRCERRSNSTNMYSFDCCLSITCEYWRIIFTNNQEYLLSTT
jgi:hypothetical protein